MNQDKRWISSLALFTAIREQLAEGRQAAFTVTGMSMWPLLCHGRDQVIVAAVEPSELKKGDIVLLQTPQGNYLLHRITRLLPDGFETTGDGNLFRDGVFPYRCLVARVTAVVRKGKTISCSHPLFCFCGRIWMALFRLRQPLVDGWFRLRPLFRR